MGTQRLRLRRRKAGSYVTRDGRYEILDMSLEWGYVSWLVFETGADEPLPLEGSLHKRSLRVAREALEAFLDGGGELPETIADIRKAKRKRKAIAEARRAARRHGRRQDAPDVT